ncbi:MAG: hypothetical protein ACYS9X_23515, partial [Planctomycetota bacterium]
WDCLATDWYHPKAYPTYLYYNPYREPKTVAVKLGGAADLYDTVSRRFIATGAASRHRITLEPDQAAVIVAVPPGGEIVCGGKGLQVNGVVIDYRAPRPGASRRTNVGR